MEPEFEKKYHSLEKELWWFVSRRNIIVRIVKKYKRNIKILEIGCASGQLISKLKRYNYKSVIGIDISKEAIKQCKNRNIENIICMDGSKLGFKNNEFDLIIASDILEHIYDDLHALNEWKRVLNKGGELILFVPAFNFLWSDHDILNKHFRRYNRRRLQILVEKCELKMIRISFWNFFLFFPIAIARWLKRIIKIKSDGDLFKINKFANIFFVIILMVENTYCKFFNLPLGLSLFIIARKQNLD
ncbi:MAG: class I SAM-dependent methyltransferase [Promethearchaeota archaeon]